MENMIDLLIGKSYKEGLEIVKSKTGETPRQNHCKTENGLYKEYVYYKDRDNWICFTCPYDETLDGKPNLHREKGCWSQSFAGYIETEIE